MANHMISLITSSTTYPRYLSNGHKPCTYVYYRKILNVFVRAL